MKVIHFNGVSFQTPAITVCSARDCGGCWDSVSASSPNKQSPVQASGNLNNIMDSNGKEEKEVQLKGEI